MLCSLISFGIYSYHRIKYTSAKSQADGGDSRQCIDSYGESIRILIGLTEETMHAVLLFTILKSGVKPN